MSRQRRGQGTRVGQAVVGRAWEEQAQAAFLDLRAWRALHPTASLTAIEQELDRRLEVLRARMLADLALASRAADLQATAVTSGERARCPQCGSPLHDGGVHQRTIVTLGNQPVELVRDYGTCPQCGSGVFPPGR